MPRDAQNLKDKLAQIKSSRFSVTGYFKEHLLSQMLSKAPMHEDIFVSNELLEEDTLASAWDKEYPNRKYLILFYAHKPHASWVSPHCPMAPRSHTSLLLCKIKDNNIDRVLNIDGYHNIYYVDILGERTGATRNSYINDRLVIGIQDERNPNNKSPLQQASWDNLNCPIYALTFAARIMAIYKEKPELIDNIFPEEKDQPLLKTGVNQFQDGILAGMVGKYVTTVNNVYIRDNVARTKYHDEVRATLAKTVESAYQLNNSAQKNEKTRSLEVVIPHSGSHSPPSSSFFQPSSQQRQQQPVVSQKNSSFDTDQIQAIQHVIDTLNAEIRSFWPYPNKGRKQHKVDAMTQLLIKAQTYSIAEAVKVIEKDFPEVRKGKISTRTSALLDKLLSEASSKQQLAC